MRGPRKDPRREKRVGYALLAVAIVLWFAGLYLAMRFSCALWGC